MNTGMNNQDENVKKILDESLLFFSKDFPKYLNSMQVSTIIDDLYYSNTILDSSSSDFLLKSRLILFIKEDALKLQTSVEALKAWINSNNRNYGNAYQTLNDAVFCTKNICRTLDFHTQNSPLSNSARYYRDKINSIRTEKEEIRDSLQATIKQLKLVQGNSDADKRQKELYEKEIEDKQSQIDHLSELYQEVQKDLSEKEKLSNEFTMWERSIKKAFAYLQSASDPINIEKSRLNKLWKLYFISFCVCIVAIAATEILFYILSNNISEWIDYLKFIQPLPIFGALLWISIVQLNRTHRLLTIHSKHLHEIQYIEGLLQSINTLSIDINSSRSNINSAVLSLFESHLDIIKSISTYDEKRIISDEKKDPNYINDILNSIDELKKIIVSK